MRARVADLVLNALQSLQERGDAPAFDAPAFEVSEPPSPDQGDFACNIALVSSKQAKMPPRNLAMLIAEQLVRSDGVASAEAAGPGFLNITLPDEALVSSLPPVLDSADRSIQADDEHYAHVQAEMPRRINVEFVSVNPNGPITIGSGRGAAYGSALCNVLEAGGHTVHREYYINDGVNSEQMRLFAESIRAHLNNQPVPENGYKGDYVEAAGHKIVAEHPTAASAETAELQDWAAQAMIGAQKSALSSFGVEFDTWFSEQSLHDSDHVERGIDHLVNKGVADEDPQRTIIKRKKGGAIDSIEKESQEPGPLWLRSTKFGDDMDRALRRSDGRLTYISSDVAYHKDKFNRPEGADQLITVLGPDHHGYIERLHAVVGAMLMEPGADQKVDWSEDDEALYSSKEEKAACLAALAESRERLLVQIFQVVRFLKDGEPAPMRKRDGNIYALIDLIKEIGAAASPDGAEEEQLRIGKDVARWFYLMRSHDTALDFDLDLAARQSDENPVFYVQYAHARICSILDKAGGAKPSTTPHGPLHARERTLILKVLALPDEVARCADDLAVHRIATYATELARTFHHFYDACRVIDEDQPETTAFRLALCRAAQCALATALGLLGVSAPQRM